MTAHSDLTQPIEQSLETTAASEADSRRGPVPLIIAVLLLAVMSAFFDRINVAVLFTSEAFRSAMGTEHNPAMLGLLMTGFVFAYGISALFLSGASDLFGARKALTVITAILTVSMLVMGACSSYMVMLLGRVILGLAEGPQFGVANLVVRRVLPARHRALGTSLWTIGSPLGSAIGFPLVFFLMAHGGWRMSFGALAALNGLIVLPAVWFLLRGVDHKTPQAATVATPPRREAVRILLRDPRLWLLTIFDSGAMIYLWGLNSWLPAYLRQAKGFDLLHAGFFSSLPFLIMILGQALGAIVGDRWRCKSAICLVGLFMAGALIFAASRSTDGTTAAWYVAISAGFWGATVPTLFALGSEIIPPGLTATGFGIYAGIANLIGAAAPFLMGALIGLGGGYSTGLLVIVLPCIILSFAMLPLLRHH